MSQDPRRSLKIKIGPKFKVIKSVSRDSQSAIYSDLTLVINNYSFTIQMLHHCVNHLIISNDLLLIMPLTYYYHLWHTVYIMMEC